MPAELGPNELHELYREGRDRNRNFRHARLMFIRAAVGQYYDTDHGNIGEEPLNLIGNTIRVMVPHLVMQNPKTDAGSDYMQFRDYAELLGLMLNYNARELDLRSIYRRWVVDSIFAPVGILKTGVASSDELVTFDDDGDEIDPGEVYTENVDFDSFIVDPNCREHLCEDAIFLGDEITVPRQALLDSGNYDNALVENLPGAYGPAGENEARNLSRRNVNTEVVTDRLDEVRVAELWIPRANAVVTIPAADAQSPGKFLGIRDFYGPKEGPYTLLSLTQPVPGNPMPAPMASMWHDLHHLANRIAVKTMNQADRQKTIVGYRGAAADDAQEALDASDGEAIRMEDPEGIKEFNFGGQMPSNEAHLAQLMGLYNSLAGTPQSLGGETLNADSATEANILDENSDVVSEDVKGMLYDAAEKEMRRRAWYVHYDPLQEVPVVRRRVTTPEYKPGPMGPILVTPPQIEEETVVVTPEMRQADFLKLNLNIKPESMRRDDSRTQLRKMTMFLTQVVPALAAAAMQAQQIGQPFSLQAALTRVGREMNFEWLDEFWTDPGFQSMQKALAQMLPFDGARPMPSTGGGSPTAAVLQNGQPGQVGPTPPSPAAEFRQGAQAGANQPQSELPVRRGL